MTASTILRKATTEPHGDRWYFPSLGVVKSDEEIEMIVDALKGEAQVFSRSSSHVGDVEFVANGAQRASLRLCLQLLTDSDGSLTEWLRENSHSFPPRLNARYEEFLKSRGLSLPARKSRGQFRFAYELEALFLAESGFSAELIASALSELMGLHTGPRSDRLQSFVRQVKSVIGRRYKSFPALSAASKVIASHAGDRQGAAAVRKALEK